MANVRLTKTKDVLNIWIECFDYRTNHEYRSHNMHDAEGAFLMNT